LTLKTPQINDQTYTIGELSKEWTYTQLQFAEMKPLCPYKLSFSFSNDLPAFVNQQKAGDTTKLSARSMDRGHATT
jgi:hypothetical protein